MTRRGHTKPGDRRLPYPPGGRNVNVMRQRSAAPLRLAGRDSKRQERTAVSVRSRRPALRVPCRIVSFVTLPDALTVASTAIVVFLVTPPPLGISPATFLRVRPPAQWSPTATRAAGGTAVLTRECGAAIGGAAPGGTTAGATEEILTAVEVSETGGTAGPLVAIVSAMRGASGAATVGVDGPEATGGSDRNCRWRRNPASRRSRRPVEAPAMGRTPILGFTGG
jgi:hypothetical protein